MRRTSAILLTTLALIGAACSSSDGNETTTASDPGQTVETETPDQIPPSTEESDQTAGDDDAGGDPGDSDRLQPSLSDRLTVADPDFTIAPGVEQVAITDAEPGTTISIVTTAMADEQLRVGTTLEPPAGGVVDAYGSLLLRDVDAGQQWQLVVDDESLTAPFDVLDRDTHPDTAFYAEQRLGPGLNYIEMRDGTRCRPTSCCPDRSRTGPTRPSSSTPATPRQTPRVRGSRICSAHSDTPTWA